MKLKQYCQLLIINCIRFCTTLLLNVCTTAVAITVASLLYVNARALGEGGDREYEDPDKLASEIRTMTLKKIRTLSALVTVQCMETSSSSMSAAATGLTYKYILCYSR